MIYKVLPGFSPDKSLLAPRGTWDHENSFNKIATVFKLISCQANKLPSWFVRTKECLRNIYIYIFYIYSIHIPYLFVRGLYGVAGGVALATY